MSRRSITFCCYGAAGYCVAALGWTSGVFVGVLASLPPVLELESESLLSPSLCPEMPPKSLAASFFLFISALDSWGVVLTAGGLVLAAGHVEPPWFRLLYPP